MVKHASVAATQRLLTGDEPGLKSVATAIGTPAARSAATGGALSFKYSIAKFKPESPLEHLQVLQNAGEDIGGGRALVLRDRLEEVGLCLTVFDVCIRDGEYLSHGDELFEKDAGFVRVLNCVGEGDGVVGVRVREVVGFGW